MNLTLRRISFVPSGIYGRLFDEHENIVSVTLEHAYKDGTLFVPKIPEGSYLCKRGMHRLASMKEDFETFEVMCVPGHTGILFHSGNYNHDSDGCILIGRSIAPDMIMDSKKSFARFMALQEGLDHFQLIVS